MKPQEILEKYGMSFKENRFYYVCQVPTYNDLVEHKDKDCVVAHLLEENSFIFIIQTARSHFAFYGMNGDWYLGGMGYKFRRLKSLAKAIKYMGEKITILNQKEFDKIKKKIVLESLKC